MTGCTAGLPTVARAMPCSARWHQCLTIDLPVCPPAPFPCSNPNIVVAPYAAPAPQAMHGGGYPPQQPPPVRVAGKDVARSHCAHCLVRVGTWLSAALSPAESSLVATSPPQYGAYSAPPPHAGMAYGAPPPQVCGAALPRSGCQALFRLPVPALPPPLTCALCPTLLAQYGGAPQGYPPAPQAYPPPQGWQQPPRY